MDMMRNYIPTCLLLIAGCANASDFLPVPIPINYQFTDNPAEQRIELLYKNTSKDTMCLLPEQWPNIAGKIDQASDEVHLIVNHERFSVVDFNTGYCPKDCSLRVYPGKKAAAFILYRDFNLPDQLIYEPKTLEFVPVAFKCS
jgi:hypothetical protein